MLYHVSRKEKFPLLLGLLRREGMERTMIFINTKREAEYLFDRLNANGFPCRVISGDVEQRKRMKILDDFKQGTLPILIDEQMRAGKLKHGQLCMLLALGAGVHWGTALVRW